MDNNEAVIELEIDSTMWAKIEAIAQRQGISVETDIQNVVQKYLAEQQIPPGLNCYPSIGQ